MADPMCTVLKDRHGRFGIMIDVPDAARVWIFPSAARVLISELKDALERLKKLELEEHPSEAGSSDRC